MTPTKKVTKEDFQKTRDEIEGIFALFKEFVHQNRPSLKIEEVATGETWFGKDALKKGLCDEIKTVDSVLADFVDQGFYVYDIKYGKPQVEPLRELFGGRTNSQDSGNIFRSGLRWVVKTIMSEVKDELTQSARVPVAERYMAKDDSKNHVRFE